MRKRDTRNAKFYLMAVCILEAEFAHRRAIATEWYKSMADNEDSFAYLVFVESDEELGADFERFGLVFRFVLRLHVVRIP